MVSCTDLAVTNQLSWLARRNLWLVGCGPLAAQLVSSVFNIWYNLTHIKPLLTPDQLAVFTNTVGIYNAIVYPVCIALWARVVMSLWQPLHRAMHHQPVPPESLLRARQRAINLPWWGVVLAATGGLLCIPVFLLALESAPGQVNPGVMSDLTISFVISTLIAITHGFFAIELLTQRLLYPLLFRGARPADTPGAFPLSLRGRGVLLVISAGACPIISLLLLNLSPLPDASQDFSFALAVAGLGIIFGLLSAWMLGQLVVEPLEALQLAARAVAAGDLNTRITLQRSDELGSLIDEFNHMISELREKQRLQETFGRHVGQKAAQQILRRDPSLDGIEQELTVMFADLRNFTARSAACPPQQVVTMLNLFLTEMVEIVEQRYGGMVNKFLGDGFMALFGVGDPEETRFAERTTNHAAMAVAAGREMLDRLQQINRQLETQGQPPLAIGIGIHTGPAIVGSIGSPQRLEYTAIGNTVNIASRVESLTKQLGQPLLLTDATCNALPATISTQQLPPQWVKGQPKPLLVYHLNGYG